MPTPARRAPPLDGILRSGFGVRVYKRLRQGCLWFVVWGVGFGVWCLVFGVGCWVLGFEFLGFVGFGF